MLMFDGLDLGMTAVIYLFKRILYFFRFPCCLLSSNLLLSSFLLFLLLRLSGRERL
jgi:hypothetical protein